MMVMEDKIDDLEDEGFVGEIGCGRLGMRERLRD